MEKPNDDNFKMKITFVVPALNLTGGLRVISIYSSYLADKGHEVTVVSPNKRIFPLWTRLKSLLKGNGFDAGSHFSDDFFDNPRVKLKVLDIWRDVTEGDVPDADVVIATFWNTAEWVERYSRRKGVKIYFIQHYEVHPWLPVHRVEETLRKGFEKIVVAHWLKGVVEKYERNSVVTVIPNGVDLSKFYSEKRWKKSQFTIGFFYSERSFKGCDTIIKSIRRVQEIYPELHVIAMGMKKPIKGLDLPRNTEYFLNPAQDDIRNIYASCDVWLFGSRSEGFGLTLLEAMACRTPVIGTKAGAAPELLTEAGGFLVEIDDVVGMAEVIKKVMDMDNNEWSAMSELAYETATNHTWERSAELFEETLLSTI